MPTDSEAGELRRQLVLYAFAAVSYISVAVFQKAILNWVVGPLWLMLVLTIGTRSWTQGRRRRGGAA